VLREIFVRTLARVARGKICDAVLASQGIFVTFRAGLRKRAPKSSRKLQVPLDQNL
jgi:hypothetical protein